MGHYQRVSDGKLDPGECCCSVAISPGEFFTKLEKVPAKYQSKAQ